MLYIIIAVTLVVIFLINFTMDFINNRKMFTKNPLDSIKFLEEKFFNKYNKELQNNKYDHMIVYDNKIVNNDVILNNFQKNFFINGVIGLIDSILLKNHNLIKINPLLLRSKSMDENQKTMVETENKKTKKNTKKKIKEENNKNIENYEIPQYDWLKILQISGKNIVFNKNIDYYFFKKNETITGLLMTNEFSINDKNEILKQCFYFENNLLIQINDTPLTPPDASFNDFFGVEVNEVNLNIIATTFSVIVIMMGQKKAHLLMIKNLIPSLYNMFINYSMFKDIKIHKVHNWAVEKIVDNIYRCNIVMALEDEVTLVEENFDFECPDYNYPQMIKWYR